MPQLIDSAKYLFSNAKFNFYYYFYFKNRKMAVKLIIRDSGTGLLNGNLSSSSAISSMSSWVSIYRVRYSSGGARTIWTFTPLSMGRRSSKIAGRKVCTFFLSLFGIPPVRRKSQLVIIYHWTFIYFQNVSFSFRCYLLFMSVDPFAK